MAEDGNKVVPLLLPQKAKAEDRKRLSEKWGQETMEAGFTVIPSILLRCQARLRFGAMELAVLVHLLEHWWNPEDMPWPSKKTIADRLDVSPRTVQRAVVKLEEVNLVVRKERYSRQTRGRTSNEYDLSPLVARLKEIAAEVNAEKEETRTRRRAITRPGLKTRATRAGGKAVRHAE